MAKSPVTQALGQRTKDKGRAKNDPGARPGSALCYFSFQERQGISRRKRSQEYKESNYDLTALLMSSLCVAVCTSVKWELHPSEAVLA